MSSAIVLGKGSLAIRVADWFRRAEPYELTAVVPVVPEPAWTDSLITWADENDVDYVASGHFADLEGVRDSSWTVDVVFSVFYDKIIPAWFIEKCGRILNLHNSPLPRYRGVSPINWALKNGEREHGVTIHEITPGIDDGPILAQVKYSIYPEIDEVRDVYGRALEVRLDAVRTDNAVAGSHHPQSAAGDPGDLLQHQGERPAGRPAGLHPTRVARDRP